MENTGEVCGGGERDGGGGLSCIWSYELSVFSRLLGWKEGGPATLGPSHHVCDGAKV